MSYFSITESYALITQNLLSRAVSISTTATVKYTSLNIIEEVDEHLKSSPINECGENEEQHGQNALTSTGEL